MKNLLAIFFLSASLLLNACAESPSVSAQSVSRIEALTEAHTRVAWVQDAAARTDVFARGSNLRLMGYDTLDNAGERIILPGPASFSKPLITRRGDRVVFSDVSSGRVYIVDWDGTNRRDLGPGYGLAVWIDPTDATEWVYVARDPRDSDGLRYGRIERRRIDDPATSEPVWDRSLVGLDSFQLSADGTRASGVFPWPECGVVRLDRQTFQRYGRGCWTSYSPDDAYRFWYFDGAHRNVTLIHERTQRRATVAVNTLPDQPGFEVYHPRWSNHPRFITLTGPYKIRSGGNNIRGGGPEVEVYIGRFNADYTEIEAWVQVTDNPHLNIYPDVWINPRDLPLPTIDPTDVAGGDHEAATAWPVVREDLIYLWHHRGGQNEITDTAGRRLRESRAEPFGLARYGRHLDMDLRRGGFFADDVHEPLLAAVRESPTLSLEAVITPEQSSPEPSVILSYGGSPESRHLALLAHGDDVHLFWRGVGAPGEAVTLPVAKLEPGQPNHIVVVIQPGQLVVYRDGREVFTSPIPPLFVTAWTEEPLVFGADRDGSRNGSGHLEGVALYQRALTADDVWDKHRAYRERLSARTEPTVYNVRARLVETSHIPTPADIAPYRRALVVNEYEIIEGDLPRENILVAHWVILDAEILPTAKREVGTIHDMTLERFDLRPDLEGERLAIDSDNLLLETYFDTDS